MKRLWQRLLQPSLVRRLMLAQLVTLLLVWLGFLGLVTSDIADGDPASEARIARHRAQLVLGVVDTLVDRPDALQQVLQRIDALNRGESGTDDHAVARVAMAVWQGDTLLYVTPGPPGVLGTQRLAELEPVQSAGRRWMTYTQRSESTGARVTLARPASAGSVALWTLSSGILVLPMLMGLPFLLLAAWVSVRLALRPWRRLVAELAGRQPQALQPLAFQAPHRELRPLTRAVDSLLARVRDGIARERSFVADAAHELRTPLAAMRINVEALQRHPLGARESELLDSLVSSNQRATRLVGQLLALMRSDVPRAGAPPQPLDLIDLVQERLAALAPIADEAEVELDFEASGRAPVRGEREGLSSLIDNLVQNAIKYSPAGGMVRVAVQTAAGHDITLSVEDDGPGIAPALRERVFDRFFRVPEQTQPGSGLGLAIVKSVAERHAARIVLDATRGEGDGDGGHGLRVRIVFARGAFS